jgi:probable F420-dependent oxidoreductase
VEFGLHLGTRGPAASPDSLLAIARRAEELGFLHLGLSDHVVIAATVDTEYPYTKSGAWFAEDTGVCLEQVTTLGFVAAATTRLRLLSSVMVLPHRPPLLAAKMLATVDVLSKGRLTVGAGVGWMAEELALLAAPPFKARGAASDEYIQAFRALWTERRPAFAGRFVTFDNLLFEPKPAQRPHPPIWVGGESAQARSRAGRLGDGWYPVGNNPAAPYDSAERYGAGLADVRAQAERAGRDPAALDAAFYAIWYRLGEAVPGRDGARLPFTGDAAAIVADIGAYAEKGLRHLVIGFESRDTQDCLDRIEAFADGVMSRFA